MRKVITDIDELEKALNENKVVIYGAGYVAKRFYESLIRRKIAKNVICFVTSKKGETNFCDLPVVTIDDLDEDRETLICVAVHESIKNEIIDLLEKRSYFNYIWIYPFQYQLMLGDPLRRAAKVLLADIVSQESEYYGLAIRYLAIEQYYNKNKVGYEIYVKAFALSCGMETAQARLNSFIKLIKNWQEKGYDESKASNLLENNEVIDGAHRIAIAVYENRQEIVCDIYTELEDVPEIHTDDAKMTKSSLEKAGFSREQLDYIEETRKSINRQYL